MVSLITSIMFLLFACMYFWVGEFYEGGPHVCRPRVNWSTITKSLRNTALDDIWVWRAMVEWYCQRKPKNSVENLSQCYLVHHKFHMDWSRCEPLSLQWENLDSYNVSWYQIIKGSRKSFCVCLILQFYCCDLSGLQLGISFTMYQFV
jgi:hypothetical protein